MDRRATALRLPLTGRLAAPEVLSGFFLAGNGVAARPQRGCSVPWACPDRGRGLCCRVRSAWLGFCLQ